MSKINIKTKVKKFKTAKNLYGIFFEDINRAGDGGLYPEMLRNRTFEDSLAPIDCMTDEGDYAIITPAGWRDEFNHGEGLSRWVRQNQIPYTPIPAWYGEGAQMELERTDTLNTCRSAALSVSFEKGGCIYNTGYCGIPQKAGKSSVFYMFAKSEKPVELLVTIEEESDILSSASFQVCGNGYIRYDGIFTSLKDTRNARLVITAREGGKIKLGFISLMPADTYNGHGLRIDLVEKLRELHPRFLRFPGGCIVEGFTPLTAMRFRNTVGPVWERPGHLLMWHYRSYIGLGFHEYLQLCEDLDLEPLYVFNCGMTCQARCSVLMEDKELDDMIQDTLDAIEYAIGPEDSKWGSLRAKMGHPSPFKMNFMEIGNENSGTGYEERYELCYHTIREKYPHIKFIANTHVEEKGLAADIVDEHFYNTAEYFAENIHFYDNYDRKGPEIFVGEFAVVRGYAGQHYAALGEADFLIGLERNQDVVTLASYAPLFENVNYNAWFPNLIRFHNSESFAIPTYYTWKMFGQNRGDYVVESNEETGTLYRPVKGMASLRGASGMRYRNARWNGMEVGVTHELMGRVRAQEDSYMIEAPDEEQLEECKRLYGIDPEKIFAVFGEEDVTEGTFEIEIFAEAGKEIEIGVYSSRIPKEVYVSDETHPPKEWNAGNVKPFIWKIKDSISSFTESSYPEEIRLSKDSKVVLKTGEFNQFRYNTDGRNMSLYLNDILIHEASVPSFPVLASVVTDTEQEVIIKAVNMAPEEEAVDITLDCEVDSDYQVLILTGDKQAENSFEDPENISDKRILLKGAGKSFTYQAPAYSVNIIRLKKV
ncbi:alpha-L-arabinofuranosidase [Anaerocolumna sedimenticola]|uniref:non-reducing end alpha-L-arabinofuranosidase n=1 Tax=Anaerocolumna sedimenticola TaxID=2696063 RepID=A0A6P1TV23_9FIRM|nr:alpha-L-arabinofuranosidase C-terminal domain-containing protein [Anaerocolumna sedimenticola]QHQ63556.1 alpha-L-arabinofuranosidase [Anaerocolumna sedimenticola]